GEPTPLERDIGGDQLADHALDHRHGSSHTRFHASTQRERNGRRPWSSAFTTDRPGGGSTGPGPGGSLAPAALCQTAARRPSGARKPGHRGRTGTTGNGIGSSPARTTTAGHD